jgi:hypothetical protein
MLTAVRSGLVIDDGRRHEIVAGKTRWHRTLSPELGRPDVAALFGVSTASAGFTTPAGSRTRAVETREPFPPARNWGTGDRSQELPELRERQTYPAQVVLGRLARETINRDLFWLTRSDGLEAGGFLFAHPRRDRAGDIDICAATHTANGQRGHRSILLDFDELIRAEHANEVSGFNLPVSGCWHCHTVTRNGKPSEADLRAWLLMRDYAEERGRRSAVHVGLIYTPGRFSDGYETWARPAVHGWVVHREGYSRVPVCDRASIRERY